MSLKPAPIMFILTASKRAAKMVGNTWEADEEGFLRRWPNNTRPDIGIQRSTNASGLIETAKRLNEAQLQSGFLDWLYSVDVDAPMKHPRESDSCCCTPRGYDRHPSSVVRDRRRRVRAGRLVRPGVPCVGPLLG